MPATMPITDEENRWHGHRSKTLTWILTPGTTLVTVLYNAYEPYQRTCRSISANLLMIFLADCTSRERVMANLQEGGETLIGLKKEPAPKAFDLDISSLLLHHDVREFTFKMARTLDSAYIGMPPLTESDFYTAKGLYIPSVMGMDSFIRNASYVVYEQPYHGADRGPAYLAGLSIAMIGVVSITATRLGIRITRKTKSFGADDVMIIPAVLCAVAYYACYIHAISNGLGKHEASLTYQQIGTIINSLNIAGLFLFAGVLLTAVSVTLFNRRLTNLSSRKWMIAHYVFLAIILSVFFTAIFGLSFIYGPNRSYFNAEYSGHHLDKINFRCREEHVYMNIVWLIHASSHVIIDLMLLCVPVVVICRTQLALAVKIRLSLVFALGAVHCSMGILSTTENGILLDTTYDTLRAGSLYNLIDITSGTIVASLPVINSLLPSNLFVSRYIQSASESIKHRFSQNSDQDPANGRGRDHRAANRIDSLDSMESKDDEEPLELDDKHQDPFASGRGEKGAIQSTQSERTANIPLEHSSV